MTYCLNPACHNPQNPHSARFCQNCGDRLLLGDRYQPLQVLGQGGFGRTFLARDLGPERQVQGDRAVEAGSNRSSLADQVVIKQVLPNRQSDPGKAIALFWQEVERLKELGQHPQIPALLGHGEQDGCLYLIQQFIAGENLEQVLAREGSFAEAQIRQLLEDLLPVLEFIHQRRVIHRDLKPENIIRPLAPPPPTPPLPLVLVDFGASKFIAESRPARTGTLIGSAGYAAPEQVMGKSGFASDLYSLGVTCVHLLTGQHPFDLYSVSKDDWVWQQYLPAPISPLLLQVLEKLLQRATNQRYRSAGEVLQDLKRQTVSVVVPSIPAEASVSRSRLRSHLISTQTQPPPEARSALAPEAQWIATGTLMGHTGGITTIALHPNGKLLASGSTDRTIKLWNLTTGELDYSFGGRSLRFSGGHSDRITALSFSPDGDLLISGSDDGTLKFWNLMDYRMITTIPCHGWGIGAIATSNSSPMFASGDVDGRIDLWDLESGQPVATLGKHRDRVSGLLLSPDGRTLISSSADRTIRLWEVESGRLIQTLRGHSDRISAIAITPDWRSLISASVDREVRFWDLNRGERGRTVSLHTAAINSLAISPDGRLLATGSEDNAIKLWHLKPDEHGAATIANRRPTTLFHSWAVNTIAFTPDGQMLVSGSADETLRLWQKHQ